MTTPAKARVETAPRTRGRPPVIGADQIVDASLRLIDRDGVDRFSLRQLADELGVANMTLYGHVADKDELLRRVVDRVLADIKTDDLDHRPPMEASTLLAKRFNAAFTAHPNVCPLLARAAPVFGAHGARVLEAQFTALARAGLGPAQSLEIYGLFLTMQLGTLVVGQVGLDRVLVGDLEDALEAARAEGDSSETPHLAAVAAAGPMATPDDRFEWMLRVLSAGLDAVGWPDGTAARPRRRRGGNR